MTSSVWPSSYRMPRSIIVLLIWGLLTPGLSCSNDANTGQPVDDFYAVLDEVVETLHAEPMMYPLYARVRSIEGVVVARATVDSMGRVREAQALSGPKGLLGEPVENLKKWRFAHPSHNSVVVVYWFRLRGLCEPPCRSGFEFYPPNLAVITIGREVATPLSAAPGESTAPTPPPK